MSSGAVALAYRRNPLHLPAKQAIHDRRFSDTRRSQKSDRCRRLQIAFKRGQRLVYKRTQRDDVIQRQPSADRFHFRLGIVRKVRLVQHDDRRRARLPHHGEVSLEPARAEILGERGHQENRVDVRGDDLSLRGRAGRLARDDATAIEAAVNDGRPGVGFDRNASPIPDHRKIAAALRVVAKPAAQLGSTVETAGDLILSAVFFNDPRKLKSRSVRCYLFLKKRTPAEMLE